MARKVWWVLWLLMITFSGQGLTADKNNTAAQTVWKDTLHIQGQPNHGHISQYRQSMASSGTPQVISADSLQRAAIAEIKNRTGLAYEDNRLTIAPLNSPGDVVLPAGRADFYIEFPYGIRFNIPTTAYAVIKLDGRVYAKANLKFDVRMFQDVVVAARSIAINEVIAPESIKYERVDIGRMAQGYITATDEVTGMLARRVISPGTPINKYMLDEPLAIRRGGLVTIIVRIGDLEVTTEGEALQSGSVGDLIRVRNSTSKRVVAARILDEKSVLVPVHQ
ncbi:hypothetical protein P22_1577 [Propionispora sp. 2/2-37]|uniref:flagellar basal body P-ring formation chaperone FlgA n=1 Tax=Propionispora sp. 2/2-37 TaxID=1677858 RepID=UPI0006BB92EA|nr:flagellar basal body P-ring formation chaperone FlgA [Propionispora sp. 2/2-37]CUH95506.1 hypothetical protein P22_1577 [Propionispora sp. 2/2-37]